MTIPTDATPWVQKMDPTDLVEYEADMSPLLEEGETISAFTVALLAEAVAAGVEISADAGKEPVTTNGDKRIRAWFQVAAANREDIIFSGLGIAAGVVFTITTSAGRRRQRTFKLTVVQL